jgi:SMI1 / KNR4 family (SUKH-1)
MLTIGESLKQYWLRYGKTKLRPGATDAELRDFERKYNVYLPTDLKDYFSQVNGFDKYDVDDDMLSFLPLDEIEPVSKDWSSKPEAISYFIFVDYSISAHVYAIRLTDDPSLNNPVFIVYDENPIQIANSFSEFAEAYLNNDYRILFP